MAATSKKTGKIVKTAKGQIGYTINSEPLVNGKVRVYLSKTNEKLLCDPAKLKIIEYYD